jgi:hypothetical protein
LRSRVGIDPRTRIGAVSRHRILDTTGLGPLRREGGFRAARMLLDGIGMRSTSPRCASRLDRNRIVGRQLHGSAARDSVCGAERDGARVYRVLRTHRLPP